MFAHHYRFLHFNGLIVIFEIQFIGIHMSITMLLYFPGSALDLHFSNINVASLDKEFDDTENCDLGLSSKCFYIYSYFSLGSRTFVHEIGLNLVGV